tara:strand:- start:65 stop:412 length:348 start_codon:yes stop_codon:yes gene_type:complete
MNLLQTLWNWLLSLFSKAPTSAIEEAPAHEEVIEEEPVVEDEPTQTATAGELITELFLSKGVSEKAIEKYEIAKHFTRWYRGELTADAVRDSIPSFKSGAPAAWVSPKINKAFEQ